MNDRFDFDLEDDEFTFDDVDDFEFDDELPLELVDDEDLPDLSDGEEAGPNRTFVFIAGLMILLFLVGLGAVLFLATRQPGPSAIDLTSTAVVATNSALQIALNQTETQSALYNSLTQTALAITDTPSPTPTPERTRPPTVTPTPTVDLTAAAGTQIAETLNAQATIFALQTLAASEQLPSDLYMLFATEVQYATKRAEFDQSVFMTEVALQQRGDPALATQVAVEIRATEIALEQEAIRMERASSAIEAAFATRQITGGAFSTLAFNATPTAESIQEAMATPGALMTMVSQLPDFGQQPGTPAAAIQSVVDTVSTEEIQDMADLFEIIVGVIGQNSEETG